MPMNVTIRIKGDAVIYDKNDLWNIVFITDKDHLAYLKVNNGRRTQLRVEDVNRHITLLPYKPLDQTRTCDPQYILNLNDLHGTTSGGNSKITLWHKKKKGRELIHLLCPIGSLSAGTEFAAGYWYYELNRKAETSNEISHKVARDVKLTFTLDDRLGVITSDQNGSKYEELPYTNGNVDMEFDNDCQTAGTLTDFLHYYDWVHEKNSERRFVAGKIEFKKGKDGDRVKGRMSNCDPLLVRPKPL